MAQILHVLYRPPLSQFYSLLCAINNEKLVHKSNKGFREDGSQ